MHDQPRPTLEQALLDPYAAPSPRTCATLLAEVAGLDAALGPDLGPAGAAPADRNGLGEELATDAIQGLVGLPYRGIVRRVSGAAERERRLKQEVLAGFVRRAYLKGVGEGLACGPASPPAAASH